MPLPRETWIGLWVYGEVAMIRSVTGAGRAFVSARAASSKQVIRRWHERLPPEIFAGHDTGEDLVRVYCQCVAQDPGAWEYRARCCMTRRLCSLCPPEDMVQQAYVSAFRSRISPGTGAAEILPWFEIVVVRTVLDSCRNALAGKRGGKERFRNLSLERDVLEGSNPSLAQLEPRSPFRGPHELAESREIANHVMRAILALNELSARLVILVDGQDVSLEEAAEELGLAAKAAKHRLSRARRDVRACLRAQGIEPPRMGLFLFS